MSIDQYSTTPANNDLTNYFKTGMRPSAVKTAGWDIMADLASYAVSLPAAAGTANALTVSNGRPFGSLVAGLLQIVNPANVNTGPATLAPDGLTAANVFANGLALAGGELQPGVPAALKYDGTQWNLLNPTLPGRNLFVDPCCRVAQGDGTTTIPSSYQYGLVDMVQCKSTATTAGKITQDSAGTAGGVTPYSCKLQNVTASSGGKVFFRRWIESRDAAVFKNQYAFFSVTAFQDTGATIGACTLTVSYFNSTDNSSAVTNIATSGSLSLPSGAATPLTLAVPNMGPNAINGVELILEIDFGTATTRNFYATDWQACIKTLAQKCAMPNFVSDKANVFRYFESSYPYGTAPGTPSANGIGFRAPSAISSGVTFGEYISYKETKLSVPAVALFSTNSGSSLVVFDATTGVDKSSVQVLKTSEGLEFTNQSGAVISAGDIIRFNYIADSRL